MTLKNVKRSAMAFAISAGFVVPHFPQSAFAQQPGAVIFPLDLFGDDEDDTEDTGVLPPSPLIPLPGNGTGNNNGNNNGKSSRPSNGQTKSGSGSKMKVAKVPEAYACPLFDNRPHAELISAIDALSREVKTSPECEGSPSAKTIEQNADTIQKSIDTLQGIMAMQNAEDVSIASIDQSMTAAIAAVGNLGNIINNNNFLNSKCGSQTMSTGKVLLALNDVITGLAPYALFAVSMNASLAPALPFVIGGAVATSGISAISKMMDKDALDMNIADHRKAVLQNTCQFTKVAKKVRFMQLAQSGKIEEITQELRNSVDLYNAKFAKPTTELSSLLAYKGSTENNLKTLSDQLARDKENIVVIEEQTKDNNDDLMICTLSNELANWAQDGSTFPASIFLNLEAATAQSERPLKLQALTLRTLHNNAVMRITENAANAYKDELALKACAQMGRSWIQGMQQALNSTDAIIGKTHVELEAQLSQNVEYRQWKAQYNLIQTEKVTISRVEKAMQELSRDTSIIDRSELAQRMVTLKAGLFGSRGSWGSAKAPVLSWIDHTKSMYDQAIAAFSSEVVALRRGAFSLTDAGQGRAVADPIGTLPFGDVIAQHDSEHLAKILGTLTLKELPVGSRENEMACQLLESAWLDWSSAIDHLGAIQFFCDMIDPVLDIKVDAKIVTSCRGKKQLNGRVYSLSLVDNARQVVQKKGILAEAKLISRKLKELQCPMPAVSVMNQ